MQKTLGSPKRKSHISIWGGKFPLIEEFKLEDEKYNTECGGEGVIFPERQNQGVDIGKDTMSLDNSKQLYVNEGEVMTCQEGGYRKNSFAHRRSMNFPL